MEAGEYRKLEIPCKEESLAVAPPRAAPSHMRVVVPKWCQVLVWTPVASVSCVVECGHRFSALTWREGATLTDSLLSHFQLSTPDTSKYFHAPQIFLLLPNIFSSQAQFSSDINASLYAFARGVSALGVNDGCFGNLIPDDSVYIAGSNR